MNVAKKEKPSKTLKTLKNENHRKRWLFPLVYRSKQ